MKRIVRKEGKIQYSQAAIPEHPGIDGSPIYLNVDVELSEGDVIWINSNQRVWTLYVKNKSDFFFGAVECVLENNCTMGYIPTKYITPGINFRYDVEEEVKEVEVLSLLDEFHERGGLKPKVIWYNGPWLDSVEALQKGNTLEELFELTSPMYFTGIDPFKADNSQGSTCCYVYKTPEEIEKDSWEQVAEWKETLGPAQKEDDIEDYEKSFEQLFKEGIEAFKQIHITLKEIEIEDLKQEIKRLKNGKN